MAQPIQSPRKDDYLPAATPRIIDLVRERESLPETFTLPNKYVDDGQEGKRMPAMSKPCNHISLFLEYTGYGLGGVVNADGNRCDTAYLMANALRGSAFDGGCMESLPEADRRACNLMGLSWEAASMPFIDMRDACVRWLLVKGLPCVVTSLPGLDFGALVVGYEAWGDVLICYRYSGFYGDNTPSVASVSNWYREGTQLVRMEPADSALLSDKEGLYRKALRTGAHMLNAQADTLTAFFDAWVRQLSFMQSEALAEIRRTRSLPGSWRQDDAGEFGDYSDDTLLDILDELVDPLWCDYAERRYYAAHLCAQAQTYFPEHKESLQQAEGCFWRLLGEMDQYINETSHDPVNREAYWNPEVRGRMAGYVRACQKLDMEAGALLAQVAEGLRGKR